jgi:Piwi domain
MSLTLNAFPILFPDDEKFKACAITYSRGVLEKLRQEHGINHAFIREGNRILCFSQDENYPVSGETQTFLLKDNFKVLAFLLKDSLIRILQDPNRSIFGFNPVEVISTSPERNILNSLLKDDFPFAIFPKMEIYSRIFRGKLFLVFDSSTRRVTLKRCSYFLEKGFNILNRYISEEDENGQRRLLGAVTKLEANEIFYKNRKGIVQKINSDKVYLEPSAENFNEYMEHSFGSQAELFNEKIRIELATFNSGERKKGRINQFRSFLAKREIKILTGHVLGIGEELDVSRNCQQFEKPVFIFNDSGEETWAEKGFSQFGPYTKRTFDKNDPSICVICSQQNKGRIEQFIRKFLKGINRHKYFSRGLEGKFHIGTSRVEFFTFTNDSVDNYKESIGKAIQKKTQDGGKWDLALVQVNQLHKKLPVNQSPYFVGKSIFFLHHIPVQDFTLELLNQQEFSLGCSLNNMALATYAKMGGVPWLLKSSPTLSHELVIGIGSTHLQEDRLTKNQRIMGITTVFSGDGSYIVSNTSEAVPPDQYKAALTNVLEETLEKVRDRRNWQKGDTIRIIFHASVKKFNRDEIEAVRSVISKYKDFNVEFSFLKIAEHHGLHLFDSSNSQAQKGKYAPVRGKFLKLSDYEMLVYLVGQREIRQAPAGHPRGLILSVHKESNFTDIQYLSVQLFNFSSHSWRSYFPNPMPVTISYSDLIAQKLGWLDKVPGWNATVMMGKLGQTQWFL